MPNVTKIKKTDKVLRGLERLSSIAIWMSSSPNTTTFPSLYMKELPHSKRDINAAIPFLLQEWDEARKLDREASR